MNLNKQNWKLKKKKEKKLPNADRRPVVIVLSSAAV